MCLSILTDVLLLTHALQKYYDLKSVKVDLLKAIQGCLGNPVEQSKLQLLLQDGVKICFCWK